ncbi:MAG: aminotransferase class I/II-fold pyridoxal phosphate-dependent enzyme [Bryobacterales bacterium]|nr:aminotransferase class I/II-fold pyridoxal phosphate-dependent enzyme [Bryobacteraceae bacterium]MDW8131089.1 aminotransferase class I/II-fold pyridoxal phosphate-dependent enzyme [Bryobacterales bacterium]
MTRRQFPRNLAWLAGVLAAGGERALAQRSLLERRAPAGMIWLNANENPDGPCPQAIEAMRQALPQAWRYHFSEFPDIYAAVARSEGLAAEQVLVGAGSSEVLCAAVHAFTSPARPLILPEPTYELPAELAVALGRRVIRVPLTEGYLADVERLAREAAQAGGGLIYLCNPNNPTSALLPEGRLKWLTENLPPETLLLVDEAYLHYVEGAEQISALRYVREGAPVVVTRTFSKIYGMAGLRVGFGCARADLIRRMRPFRSGVISWVSAQAALAALAEAPRLIPERRQRLARIRGELCAWLRERGFEYIEPQANFVMIRVNRDVRTVIEALWERGIAVGRPFPPLDHMLRVSIGTSVEMTRFREVFEQVLSG